MTLQPGDIVTKGEEYWRVVGEDLSMRQVTLVNLEGKKVRVNSEDTEYKKHANPPKQWPVLNLPLGSSPIVSVRLARGIRVLDLQILRDWVPTDFVKNGGAIFLNPSLKLRPGEVLAFTYKNGRLGRAVIPVDFKTFAQKQKADQPPSEVDDRDFF